MDIVIYAIAQERSIGLGEEYISFLRNQSGVKTEASCELCESGHTLSQTLLAQLSGVDFVRTEASKMGEEIIADLFFGTKLAEQFCINAN